MNAAEQMLQIPLPRSSSSSTARPVQALEGETILQAAERARRRRSRACATRTAIAPTATAAPAWSRSRASARWRRAAAARRRRAWRCRRPASAPSRARRWWSRCCCPTCRDEGYKWVGDDATQQHGELSDWAARLGVSGAPRAAGARAASSRRPTSRIPAMAVNLDACIQCNALRARLPRGAGQRRDRLRVARRPQRDRVRPRTTRMGDSTCVACGECVQACPTGALMPKTLIGSQAVDRKVDSVCPFCGVGCLITYNVKDERDRQRRRPRRPGQPQPPVRQGPLRLRLRAPPAAPDEAADPQGRRRQGLRAKSRDPADWRDVFREATWEEALDADRGQAEGACATRTARSRWPASARPRAATRRPTCSRSWCAPASAATTSTTARGCAMPRAWRRCSKASAPARSATRSTTSSTPT